MPPLKSNQAGRGAPSPKRTVSKLHRLIPARSIDVPLNVSDMQRLCCSESTYRLLALGRRYSGISRFKLGRLGQGARRLLRGKFEGLARMLAKGRGTLALDLQGRTTGTAQKPRALGSELHHGSAPWAKAETRDGRDVVRKLVFVRHGKGAALRPGNVAMADPTRQKEKGARIALAPLSSCRVVECVACVTRRCSALRR